MALESNGRRLEDHRSATEILKGVAENLDRMTVQTYAPKPKPTMEGEVQNLLNLAAESVDRIYKFGGDKIGRIEDLCRVARQALETKRNAVDRSMAEYLAALEAVQNTTNELDKALSNVIVQNDAIGH